MGSRVSHFEIQYTFGRFGLRKTDRARDFLQGADVESVISL